MKKSKGFTLIELLVVIAIIGILASIVLVSLSSARNKANDARIKADIAQVRSTAELWYDDNSFSYATLCSATNNVDTLIADMDIQNGAGVTPVCFADADSYCVSSVLKTTGTVCVSSSGQTGNDTCIDADTVCAP